MKQAHSNAPLKNRKTLVGFTLIEMLLVVIILAILTTIATPNFSKAYKSIILQKQSEDIIYVIKYAQSRAVTRNSYVKFSFNDDMTKYRLYEAENSGPIDANNAHFNKINSRLAREHKIYSDIIINSDVNAILFYPDGVIDKADINVCNETKCFILSTKAQRGNVRLIGPISNE